MKSLSYLALFAVGVSCSAIAHAQADTEASDRIVVTGSRIVRDGTQMPVPVTVVTSEALTETAPSNIPDALNQLPQFTGSTSQTAGATFNAGSAPLGNYLNLRGLNSSRLLVLLDGQRVAPTARSNAVDVNVLPQMLVQRVDIVTGGVSAIYGSDAVSGVVNYVLDEDFTGLKTQAQAGISDYGDSFSVRLGAAGGVDLGDAIHVMGSYEYYDNNGIPDLFDRPWAPFSLSGIGRGTASDPFRVYPFSTRTQISAGGTIWGCADNAYNCDPTAATPTFPSALVGYIEGLTGDSLPYGVRFTPDGELVPHDPGDVLAYGNSIGGDGGIWGVEDNSTSIAGTLETHQAFGRITVDLSPTTQIYAQGIYANSKTSFNSAANNHITGTRLTSIYADNPYLAPEYQDVLNDAGQTRFFLGKIWNDIPVVKNDVENEYVSGQVGIEGDLSGWLWGLAYNYGQAKQNTVFNEFKMRNFFAAVDAVRDPVSGEIVCRVNSSIEGDPANDLAGCVPINLLGEGNITQAAFDWTRQDSISDITNTMHYVNANVQGGLFDLPAGEVSLSVGAEWRRQELTITSNSNPAFFSDENGNNPALRAAYFSGIRGVPGSAQLFDSINVGIADGSQTVKEAYGELVVPVLAGAPFAEYLELDLAARLTDYETSGSVKTWKVGVIWQPVDSVRVRFNRSRDIAAPDLNSLYAGENVNASGFNDIHIDDPNARGAVPLLVTQGNENLEPEVADTLTLGVVFQPSFVPGLSLSVDAYKIEIKGAIDNPSAAQMNIECEASNGTAPVCDSIIRPGPFSDRSPANLVTRINVSPQNLSLLETQGIDFEAAYTVPVGPGDLTFRGFVNYLDSFKTQQSATQPLLENVGRSASGNSLPKWRALLSQSFRTDRFSFTVNERFTGTYDLRGAQPVSANHPDGHTVYADGVRYTMPNVVYVSLNATYNFDEEGAIQGFFNVQNLFNVDPPATYGAVSNLSVQTDKSLYDVVGRYFTVGVRTRF